MASVRNDIWQMVSSSELQIFCVLKYSLEVNPRAKLKNKEAWNPFSHKQWKLMSSFTSSADFLYICVLAYRFSTFSEKGFCIISPMEKKGTKILLWTSCYLHLSQKLLRQHLLLSIASFITFLHKGQYSSDGRLMAGRAEGMPSISFSKAALLHVQKQ